MDRAAPAQQQCRAEQPDVSGTNREGMKPAQHDERRLVWVTGAGGLIGSYLLQAAPQYASQWRVRGLTHAELDLADFPKVRDRFQVERPEVIIHCAALSKSPECQKNPGLARKLNVEVSRVLAELALDIALLFFSTDLVFDGKRGNYEEQDLPNPLSVYGETKAEAESLVLANPRHTVVRTSLNYGISPSGDRAFNELMAQQWTRGQTTRLFSDEFRSPIAAEVTARAIWELIGEKRTGLFHVAGSERLSRWEIGNLIATRYRGAAPRIEATSIRDYQGEPRPADTSLNSAKAQAVLSFQIPRFAEWLANQ
ncbi:MAG TPA: SDR family oxidoreductase [Candidatus Dormibacteraeota bacterium]|nr:SDR family oxidoreductase [Candidatus Dormibacteraeota bacterium]